MKKPDEEQKDQAGQKDQAELKNQEELNKQAEMKKPDEQKNKNLSLLSWGDEIKNFESEKEKQEEEKQEEEKREEDILSQSNGSLKDSDFIDSYVNHFTQEQIDFYSQDKGDNDNSEQDELGKNKKYITAVETCWNCCIGILEELRDIKYELETVGAKNPGADDYTQDGKAGYKRMAGALEECIKSLSEINNNKRPVEIIQKLQNLEKASGEYYDSHFGLMGFPIHRYGRKRLEQSFSLTQKVPSMILTMKKNVKILKSLNPDAHYDESGMIDLIQTSEELKEQNGINDIELPIKYYDHEKRCSDAQISAFGKLKDYNRKLYEIYSSKSLDDYMEIIDDRKNAVGVPTRAQIYVLNEYMEDMLKANQSPEELEDKLKNFTLLNVDNKTNKLMNNSLFDEVQRICHKKRPDNGLTTWKLVQKKANALKNKFRDKLNEFGDIQDIIYYIAKEYDSENDSEEYDPENSSEEYDYARNPLADFDPMRNDRRNENVILNAEDPVQLAIKNVCDEAATILVYQAMLTNKGRKVLEMIAIEGTPKKVSEMTEFVSDYLYNNRVFVPRRNQTMQQRVQAKMNDKLVSKVLDEFLSSKPKTDMSKIRNNQNIQNNIVNNANRVMGS